MMETRLAEKQQPARQKGGGPTLHLVVLYRRFAADYRRLAATLKEPADKQAMELFATGWDRVAENREAMLRRKEREEL